MYFLTPVCQSGRHHSPANRKFVMTTIDAARQSQQSRYLSGNYAPIHDEITSVLAPISGEIPADLSGTFARNGANPRFEPKGRYHWFDGDGMIHAVQFESGTATYRNRWVRTEAFALESTAGESLWTGIMEPPDLSRFPQVFKDTANTDLCFFRGELLALWWLGGDAYRIDLPTLDTVGVQTFDGTLTTHMSAHPKVDHAMGELLYIDFDPLPPYLTLGTISSDGRVARSQVIELDGPRLQHDIAFTRDWLIVFDFSFMWSRAALREGRTELEFARDVPTRFGLVSRHDPNAAVRWFETEPCFMYHVVNAWQDDDGNVQLLGCRTDDPLADDPRNPTHIVPTLGKLRLEPMLTQWTFDVGNGSLRSRQLWDRVNEFPRMDDRVFGREHRYAYTQRAAPAPTLLFDAVVRHDLLRDTFATHEWPRRWHGGETVFCARSGATVEGDGYLITFVVEEATGESELHILDACDMSAAPVCRLAVPQRVPTGYHGCWIPADELMV